MNLPHGLKSRMRKLTKTLASNTQGFTLIEVLISITIMGIMSLGIISFSDFVINSSESTISEDKDFLRVETAMSRLEWDISQIYTPLAFDILMNPAQMTPNEGEIYNQLIDIYQRNQRFAQLSYEGLPVPIYENPEKDEFIFLTTSNRRKIANTKQSRFAWVRYSLAPDEGTRDEAAVGEFKNADEPERKGGSVLIRQIYNKDIFSPEDIPWSDVKSQVLLRNVDRFVFEFWNPKTSKWTDNLQTITQGVHRIYAVKVNLTFFDILNAQRYTERIFRPLFSDFQAEDVYKFLKQKPRTGNTRGDDSSSSTTTTAPTAPGDDE